jgi:hypothetical protein
MNANWIAGADGAGGDFELIIVTSDDRQHVVAPSPAAMTALVALAQGGHGSRLGPGGPKADCRQPARHDALDGRPSRVPEAALQGSSR